MLREICHSLSSSSSLSCHSIHFSLTIYHSVAMPLYTSLAKWCENDKKRFNFDGCESIRPTQRIVKKLLEKKLFCEFHVVARRTKSFLPRYHRWFFIGKHDKWNFSWRVSIKGKMSFGDEMEWLSELLIKYWEFNFKSCGCLRHQNVSFIHFLYNLTINL